MSIYLCTHTQYVSVQQGPFQPQAQPHLTRALPCSFHRAPPTHLHQGPIHVRSTGATSLHRFLSPQRNMTASGTNTTAIAIARTARFSSRSLNVCLFPSRPTPRPCLAFARPRLPGNLSHGCLPFCCVRPPAWFAHPLPPLLALRCVNRHSTWSHSACPSHPGSVSAGMYVGHGRAELAHQSNMLEYLAGGYR